MKDRIRQLMESQNMTQQTFADYIGISSASLSSIFTARTKPTLNTVEAIKNKFPNINLDWLLYGDGQMFKGDENSQPVNDGAGSPVSGKPGMEPMIDFDNSSHVPARPSFDGGGSQSMTNQYNSQIRTEVKYIDKPQRQITEIRIFFSDQTYESFVPKK